ncbi:MAG: ribokinase [Chloroflexi bacterium]|nr:ribokinase [Chloroflexota bacterium]
MVPDFLVIGHLVLDATDQGFQPGGTVYYAAYTALRLGRRTAVLTNARPDYDVAAALPGAAVQAVGSATTIFENQNTPQGRRQRVRGGGTLLTVAAVPAAWRRAPIVLLGPVLGEVAPALAAAFPESLVGVTPQGWMRQVGPTGWITAVPWTEAPAVLPWAGAVVLSPEDVGGREAQVQALAAQARLLVVTEGAHGCRILQGGREQHVPAFPAQERDATGAGDVFAAAFLIRLAECGDPQAAAAFANAVAACSVEAPGVAGIPTASQVAARMARYGR